VRFKTLIAAGMAVVGLASSGSAQATTQATIKVATPKGFLSPVMEVFAGQTFPSPSVPGGTVTVNQGCGTTMTCYLPNPNVPIPVVTVYVDASHEAVSLGASNGLALQGTLDAPATSGECVVAIEGVGGTIDPNGPGLIAQSAPLSDGQTDLSGVVLAPLAQGGTVLTNAQVIALGWWDDDGLDVYVAPCQSGPVVNDMTGFLWITSADAVAAYAPAAHAGGDPWYVFHSVFRGRTYMFVNSAKTGKLVRWRDLGWLSAGKHKTSFKCGTLRGKFHVYVRGIAHDGAAKSSPVRTVSC
jgi:hypothetical protein